MSYEELEEKEKEYLSIEDFEQRILECNHAIELDPKNEWKYQERGYCFFKLNQFLIAKNDFDKAISLNSNLPDSYDIHHMRLSRYLRGGCNIQLGNSTDAQTDFEWALEFGLYYAEDALNEYFPNWNSFSNQVSRIAPGLHIDFDSPTMTLDELRNQSDDE